MKAARAFTADFGAVLPERDAELMHNPNNPTLKQAASFTTTGSSSLTMPGLSEPADTLNAGVDLSLYAGTCGPRTGSVSAGYDHDRGSKNDESHQGMIKLTVHFGPQRA